MVDYQNSGYDRGHLVSSADQSESNLQNSETFLLSNISPQAAEFNRGVWKKLETAIRELNARPDIYETYVICGPIFDFDTPVAKIGTEDSNGVSLPIPNAFFKSVLTENNKGKLHMWSFILPNEKSDDALEKFQVPTIVVEQMSGILLWERLVGKVIEREKKKVRNMW